MCTGGCVRCVQVDVLDVYRWICLYLQPTADSLCVARGYYASLSQNPSNITLVRVSLYEVLARIKLVERDTMTYP